MLRSPDNINEMKAYAEIVMKSVMERKKEGKTVGLNVHVCGQERMKVVVLNNIPNHTYIKKRAIKKITKAENFLCVYEINPTRMEHGELQKSDAHLLCGMIYMENEQHFGCVNMNLEGEEVEWTDLTG